MTVSKTPEKNDIILITGPTASGKSRLGIDIARQCHGVVINADSMQIYEVLHLLTGQPNENERASIPHFLYAFVKPNVAFSTGHWLAAVRRLLQNPEIIGRTCVFVGGTGLYFRSLLGGLAKIPPIDTATHEKWRLFLQQNGIKSLYTILSERDPVLAQRLSPNDGQRMLRALEVLDSTGSSIAQWQQERREPLVDIMCTRRLVLAPERYKLMAYINARFDKIIEKGALEEVKQLRAMQLDPALPIMKAIGVRELSTYLDGHITLESAIEKAKIATRRYAKRQMTWLRHQLDADWQHFSSIDTALQSFASTSFNET
ncbi:MAG: tRNA dimethylallyltransferase [Candidatus Tokpelaia sp. JSC085]|nr:MAG: tRNA dimethylallyltransferase [Candidatus Tokpelaia sp. JSC085]